MRAKPPTEQWASDGAVGEEKQSNLPVCMRGFDQAPSRVDSSFQVARCLASTCLYGSTRFWQRLLLAQISSSDSDGGCNMFGRCSCYSITRPAGKLPVPCT